MTNGGPTCGDYGGTNARGEPCANPAGSGTSAARGPCSYHRQRAPANESDLPEPPADLRVESRQVWNETVRRWRFSPPEREILAGALRWLERYRDALETVREEGPVSVNPDSGNPKRNPAVSVAEGAYREFRLSVKQLGLEERG